MKQIHVIATWESEHLVELEDGADVGDLVQLLGGQSNVKLVGYTTQPLDEAVDAAVDELLGPESPADP
jgi:microcompartment protein CcmK/EutM